MSIKAIKNENIDIRRIKKATVAGYRVLAQAEQLLLTKDFELKIKNYSLNLYNDLMKIKYMDDGQVNSEFLEFHINEIKKKMDIVKDIYNNLPEEIHNQKPDYESINKVLLEIYE